MDVVAIQQNLGHADLSTTLRYIGVLDADKRRPPALYDFNLAALDKIHVQEAMAA
jgi:integrase